MVCMSFTRDSLRPWLASPRVMRGWHGTKPEEELTAGFRTSTHSQNRRVQTTRERGQA